MKQFLIVLALMGYGFGQAVPAPVPSPSTPTSTIAGQIQTSTGGVIKNGTLSFTLSQPAVSVGTAAVAQQASACYTSNQGNIAGLPDPVVAPITSVNTGTGTLAAGTYYVVIYYINANGQVSAPSPEAIVQLTAAGSIVVNPPALQPSGTFGYGIAISTASGAEKIQATKVGFPQYQQATALVAGATPQANNNSACYLWFSDSLVPTGTYYTVNLLNKNGAQIVGFPQTWCTYGGQAATINVSQGAPTGNCNTNGVFYPTPIFSGTSNAQSVSSPISFAGGVTGNTTFTGSSSICAQNGTSVVGGTCSSVWGGGDIGSQINNAYTAGPSSGVHISVTPGSYSYTTPIVLGTNNKPALLECSAGQQGIALPPLTGTTTLIFTPTTGTAITFNGGGVGSGMRGCTLEGSGSGNSTIGLSLSNSTGGNATQNLYESDDVSNFGTGLYFGQNTFLNHFLNSFFHDNGTNLLVPSTSTQAQENSSFFGGGFYTKTNAFNTACINILSNWDMNFYGVSFDQCGITVNATGVHMQMHGGHMENPNAATSNQYLTIGSSCTQCFVDLFGVVIQEDFPGSGRTSLISNGANGSHLLVQGGYEFVGGEAPITAFVATVSGSTTTLTDISQNGSVFTGLTSGSGAFSWMSGGQISTNVTPLIFPNTTISFGAGAPSGPCIGNTGIYLRNDATSTSSVLYDCQASTWTQVNPVYCTTSQKSETGTADANVLTCTPVAAAGTYRACFTASVSSATSGVIGWTLSWTDSNGNAESNIAQSVFQQGSATPALTFTTSSANDYQSCSQIDVNNAAGSIVIKWVGGGTTAAKVSATVERII